MYVCVCFSLDVDVQITYIQMYIIAVERILCVITCTVNPG